MSSNAVFLGSSCSIQSDSKLYFGGRVLIAEQSLNESSSLEEVEESRFVGTHWGELEVVLVMMVEVVMGEHDSRRAAEVFTTMFCSGCRSKFMIFVGWFKE